MMGQKAREPKLFYLLSLDQRVPQDHLLRRISQAVDFSFVYKLARSYYSHTGQPSIDPVVVLKMALLQYLYNIPSERRLAEELPLNLAWLWFLGYDLDEDPPTHSVLSKARSRFGEPLYQAFFAEVVQLCERAGLVRGDKLFLDASLVEANASWDSLVSRPLYQQLPGPPEEFVTRLFTENHVPEEETREEGTENAEPPDGSSPLAEEPPRLQHLRANERRVSRTDPDAAIVDRRGTGPTLVYKAHFGVDGGHARVITAVDLTAGDWLEAHTVPYLVESHERLTQRRLREAVADRAYGIEANYLYLRQRGILPTMPRRRSWTAKYFPDWMFTYDPASDSFLCPAGQHLGRQGKVPQRPGVDRYRAGRRTCLTCSLKAQCTAGSRRSVQRHLDASVLDWAWHHLETPRARQSLRERQVWAETEFAEGKNWHGLRRARYRRRWRVRIQVLLIATVQNLKKLARATGLEPLAGCVAVGVGSPFCRAGFAEQFEVRSCLTFSLN